MLKIEKIDWFSYTEKFFFVPFDSIEHSFVEFEENYLSILEKYGFFIVNLLYNKPFSMKRWKFDWIFLVFEKIDLSKNIINI